MAPSGHTPAQNVLPKNKTLQAAFTPVLFPLGVAALCVDQCLLHPASVLDDAIEDTVDVLWTFDNSGRYMAFCATLPWRIALTPIVFLFDWLGRSLFDISHNNSYRFPKT
jgi:hypothetical protein